VASPPDTAKLLAQERRLMRPAGWIALLGLALFVASIALQTSIGGDDLDTDAGLLRSYSENGNELILSRVLIGLAFLSFAPALYVLFRGAQARIPNRIRPAMVAFCFIGPVLWAFQAPILAVGLKDAGDQFVSEEPALEADSAQGDQSSSEGSGSQDGAGGASAQDGAGQSGQGEAAQEGGSEDGEVTTTPTEEGTTATDGDEDSEDSGDDPVEQRAEDIAEDNGTVTFARALQLPAVIGMLAAMVYISLWAMRAGLLTRFMGSFGMALGVSLIILPFAQLMLPLWFAVLGLILLGRWIRPRPPAWDAGEAIPWQRPGDEPQDPGDIEGSGRELDRPPGGEDRPGGSYGPTDIQDGPTDVQNGDGPGEGDEPRKRKRRR
jgi:hypothetical protein